jgi:hypothetical protein
MLIFNYLHFSITYIGIKSFQRQFKNYVNANLTKYLINHTHHESLLKSASVRPMMDSMQQIQFTVLYFDMVGRSAASLKTGGDPVPEKWCCINFNTFNTIYNVKSPTS